MTVAQLGLAVDSSQVSTATPALERMAAASAQAEAAANRLGMAGRTEAAGTAAATSAARLHTVALQAEAAAARMVANDTRMLGFQINDIVVSLASGMNPAMVALQQGSQIAQMGLRNVAGAALSMARSFAPVLVVVGAVGLAVAALTGEINKNQKQHVSWANVVEATWQLAWESVVKAAKPVTDFFGHLWDETLAPGVLFAANKVIGAFVFAYDAIKLSWSYLPQVIGDISIQTAQNVLNAVTSMGREVIANINGVIAKANGLLAQAHLPGMSFIGTPNSVLPDVKLANPFSGYADEYGAQIGAAGADFDVDYVGGAIGAIGSRARKIALANAEAEKKSKKLADTIRGPLTDGIDKLTAKTSAWADAATSAFSNLGTGIVNAFTKGGNVAMNVLDMLLGKIGDFGTSLLNSGLNSLLNAAIGGITGAMTPTGGVWGNGLWGSAIFAGVHHNGGVAGFPSMGRTVPASLFDGALRYHGGGIAGLRPDEVPAILQRGERITPANQNGAPSFSISVTVNADSTTNGAAVARQVAQELRRQVPDLIAASQRNPYRRTA